MCRKYIITGTNKIRPKRKGNFDREVKVTFLFYVIGSFVPITQKAMRESYCGEVESCRKRDPLQAENPAIRILKKGKHKDGICRENSIS